MLHIMSQNPWRTLVIGQFYLTNQPKSKYIQFSIILNEDKHQILKSKENDSLVIKTDEDNLFIDQADQSTYSCVFVCEND